MCKCSAVIHTHYIQAKANTNSKICCRNEALVTCIKDITVQTYLREALKKIMLKFPVGAGSANIQ